MIGSELDLWTAGALRPLGSVVMHIWGAAAVLTSVNSRWHGKRWMEQVRLKFMCELQCLLLGVLALGMFSFKMQVCQLASLPWGNNLVWPKRPLWLLHCTDGIQIWGWFHEKIKRWKKKKKNSKSYHGKGKQMDTDSHRSQLLDLTWDMPWLY